MDRSKVKMIIYKRHRPPPDKTSGLSFDTAMYPHEYKTYTETPDEQAKRIEREKKNHTVRPAGLKPRRSLSYIIITKNSYY
jgi:hypothetical protein